MQTPRIFIILLNWNGYRDTIECLESILKITYPNYQIVIVDNHSEDDSIVQLTKWAEEKKVDFQTLSVSKVCESQHSDKFLTILKADQNYGFAGGNNIGMNFALHTDTEFILLLNNDTIVTRDFLSHMVKTAIEQPNIGAVGGKIYYYPETSHVWFSGGYINHIKGGGYHFVEDHKGLRECDFITGCLALFPSHILKEVGLFDERYFLISEDTDLSQRIRIKGYKLIVDCNAIIYHKLSRAIGGKYSPRNQYYFHRNRMLFFKKFLPKHTKFLFFFFQFLIIIPVWILIELVSGRKTAVKWASRGYRDFLHNITGKCPYRTDRN